MKALLLGDVCPTAVASAALFAKQDIPTLFDDTLSLFQNSDFSKNKSMQAESATAAQLRFDGEYCINGGEMVDGKWQPTKDGLGLGHVLDYIGVKYD